MSTTNSPLHLAVQNGNIDIVKTLLAAGQNPDEANAEGLTPLHIAVQMEHAEMVALLAEAIKKNNSTPPPVVATAPNANTPLEKEGNFENEENYYCPDCGESYENCECDEDWDEEEHQNFERQQLASGVEQRKECVSVENNINYLRLWRDSSVVWFFVGIACLTTFELALYFSNHDMWLNIKESPLNRYFIYFILCLIGAPIMSLGAAALAYVDESRYGSWILPIVIVAVVVFLFIRGFNNTERTDSRPDAPVAGQSKPDLPITVRFRESALGAGMVIIITNNSKSSLTVECQSTHAETNHTFLVNFELPAGKTKEYGWMELGYQIVPGGTFNLSHPDYQTRQYRVPAPTR